MLLLPGYSMSLQTIKYIARPDSMPCHTSERTLHIHHLCDNKQRHKQDKFSKLVPMINKLHRRFLKFSFNRYNTSIA